METRMYYNPISNGVLVTSNFEELQRKMELRIAPQIEYEHINISNFGNYSIKGIAFDGVDNLYFQSIKKIFDTTKFESIAFHHSHVDLSKLELYVNHLNIGENCNFNFSTKNFNNLKELTFQSLKTFKGQVLDKIISVEKLILWYENRKSNEILTKFPSLKEFYIYNGSIVELDLSGQPLLKTLQLHRCIKLKKVVLHPKCHLNRVIVQASNKLDTSNLGDNVVKV